MSILLQVLVVVAILAGGYIAYIHHTHEIEKVLKLLPDFKKSLGLAKSATVKVVVYVPESHAERMREAMANAGAGAEGHYTCRSFSISGTGRYKPEHGANPMIGTNGTLEVVPQDRIEVTVARGHLAHVVSAIKHTYPYEELVIDIYPLEGEAAEADGHGHGGGHGDHHDAHGGSHDTHLAPKPHHESSHSDHHAASRPHFHEDMLAEHDDHLPKHAHIDPHHENYVDDNLN